MPLSHAQPRGLKALAAQAPFGPGATAQSLLSHHSGTIRAPIGHYSLEFSHGPSLFALRLALFSTQATSIRVRVTLMLGHYHDSALFALFRHYSVTDPGSSRCVGRVQVSSQSLSSPSKSNLSPLPPNQISLLSLQIKSLSSPSKPQLLCEHLDQRSSRYRPTRGNIN